jgi:hypothetical protein
MASDRQAMGGKSQEVSTMRRICDACGKKKNVRGGKTCASAHFICKDCAWKSRGLFFAPVERRSCPLCEKPLK